MSELTLDDYRVILKSIAGDFFSAPDQIDWLLQMTQEVEALCSSLVAKDECTVNMRDLSRFVRIYEAALGRT